MQQIHDFVQAQPDFSLALVVVVSGLITLSVLLAALFTLAGSK